MTYREAKRLNLGDWVGVRGYDEDGIVVSIKRDSKYIIFEVMLESFGRVEINHKNLNPRTLMILPGYTFSDILDEATGKRVLSHEPLRDYSDALKCPSVNRLNLTNVTNEELFALWGVPNPLA